MKEEYIITSDELKTNYGLDLEAYALDSSFCELIIKLALGKLITRILYLNDNLRYEKEIEKSLDDNEDLVNPFKKAQFQVIYNLVFLGDNDPINAEVDNIICCDLRFGKINGWQKNIVR